jgi:hypothetical protein
MSPVIIIGRDPSGYVFGLAGQHPVRPKWHLGFDAGKRAVSASNNYFLTFITPNHDPVNRAISRFDAGDQCSKFRWRQRVLCRA